MPSVAFAEAHDVLPLIAWLHKDALIARLDAEIATEADDGAALTHEVRRQRQAEVLGDLLSTEREESFFVRRGQREGLPVEHRSDCSPEGILQVASIVAPRVTASGSSREHAIDVVHHSGQSGNEGSSREAAFSLMSRAGCP